MKRGYCWCGCEQETKLATRSNRKRGDIRGEPVRYLFGHSGLKSPIEYLEEECGHDTPCWIWQRGKNDRGYGQTNVDGRQCYAHRAYYERVHGPIPDDLELDHLCRMPACVNPDHLEAVTHKVNMQRGNMGRKLTLESAREIRRLYKTGCYSWRQLGRKFGVDKAMIGRIIRGTAWLDPKVPQECGQASGVL